MPTTYLYQHVRETIAIDGDTIRVAIDLGFRITKRIDVRLGGIDTPEVNRGSLLHRKAGRAAAIAASEWLDLVGLDHLSVASYDLDKYAGRIVGDLLQRNNAQSLATYLIAHGYAKPTNDEGTRQPWTDAELQAITQICSPP